MPTSTFFRLPEEKRQRLLAAAREEFGRVSLEDVSINRIVRNASIPRGSFYQYFSDKLDLFQYLLQDMRDYFYQTLQDIILETGGDLFAVPLGAFERLATQRGGLDPVLSGCVSIMRANPRMDMCWLFGEGRTLIPDEVFRRLDLRGFRRDDRESVNNALFLMIPALGHAIISILANPDSGHEEQKELLRKRVDIIKYGSLKQTQKEDNKC